jgi:hypothetical protein
VRVAPNRIRIGPSRVIARLGDREGMHMGFDELKKKASELLGNEEKTDDALDRAARFANEKTGGKYEDKVQQGRDFADGKVGDERA